MIVSQGCSGSGSSTPPPDTQPPTAPTSLVATAAASGTQIGLTWTASTDNVGVTGYKIERCSGASCANFSQVGTGVAANFNDTGLTDATSYSYRVRATDAAGNLSGYSNVASATTPDTTPPSTPANLMATATSSTQIALSWMASTDNVGVTGYDVQRCAGSSCNNFAHIATSATNGYNDSGLSPGTTYGYQVRATDAAANFSGFSTAAYQTTKPSGISVSLSPKAGGVAVSQALVVTATVMNDGSNSGVTWSSVGGGTFAACTAPCTTVTYTAPGAAGSVTITATSVADPSRSASATLGVTDLAGVFTYHNDAARDGANTKEHALTTGNVTSGVFGKLFSCQVDGAIYAQPLWVAQLNVGGTKHNVVIAVTMHESVYAFDADAAPCSMLWKASLIDSGHGGTAGESSVPSGGGGSLVGAGYGDIQPEVGITSTPVIDPGTSTLYVLAKSVIASGPTFFQRLHALDLTNGTEKFGGPQTIAASVPGNAPDSVAGQVIFNPRSQAQRPGLALSNGVVYVCWASHEDQDPYHGWIMGFSASTLAPVAGAVLNTTPNTVNSATYARGGIWMGGGAPAIDSSGNLYVVTGNGTFDGARNFGDSILKVSTTSGLAIADWFTPSDESTLDADDLDLGSGAAMVLIDRTTAPLHLMIGGGKHGSGSDGQLFVLNRDAMGGFTAADTGIVQKFALNQFSYATPAFWNNSLYIAGATEGSAGGPLLQFTFSPSAPVGPASPFNPVAASSSSGIYGFPGATPSVSANGSSTNGIVWALDNKQYCTPQSPGCGPAVLHAYDATNLAHELWNSSQSAADAAGFAVKFTVPTVANGKVYVGTRGADTGSGSGNPPGELDVYGLLP